MSIQGYWADLPAAAFRGLPNDLIAVLPIGAIEQHGPHLPLSVDRDLVDAVIERTIPKLKSEQNVLFLPTLAVTKSGEHDNFPGTLSLSAETVLAMLREIGASIARVGVQRLVLFNGHGGNTAVLEIASRDLRMDHNLIVATCSWFGFANYQDIIDEAALAHDIHAGDIETSAMLSAQPQKVNMANAKNFEVSMTAWEEKFNFTGLTGQAARPGWIVEDLNRDGACGNAAQATAEKGERLLDSAAVNFASFLGEFRRFDHREKDDE